MVLIVIISWKKLNKSKIMIYQPIISITTCIGSVANDVQNFRTLKNQ